MASRPPQTGMKLMQALSQLGAGLRGVVDPHFEERERTEELLLRNPEIARSLRRSLEEGKQAMQAGDVAETGPQVGPLGRLGAVSPTPEQVNPLSSREFSLEQAEESLQLAGALSPAEEAEQEEGRARLEMMQRLQELGWPREAAMARVMSTRAEGAGAETELNLQENLSGKALAEAKNMGAKFETLEASLGIDQLNDYLELRNEVKSGESNIVSWDTLRITERNPQALAAAHRERGLELEEERMDLRERIAQLDRLEDQQDRAVEKIGIAMDLREEISNQQERLWDAREQGRSDEEIESIAQGINEQLATLARYAPEMARGTLLTVSENFFSTADIKFNPTPRFVSIVGDNPELIKPTLKLVARSREDIPDDFELPERVESREELDNLAGRLVGRFFSGDNPTFMEIADKFSRGRELSNLRNMLKRNFKRQLAEKVEIAEHVPLPDPMEMSGLDEDEGRRSPGVSGRLGLKPHGEGPDPLVEGLVGLWNRHVEFLKESEERRAEQVRQRFGGQ